MDQLVIEHALEGLCRASANVGGAQDHDAEGGVGHGVGPGGGAAWLQLAEARGRGGEVDVDRVADGHLQTLGQSWERLGAVARQALEGGSVVGMPVESQVGALLGDPVLGHLGTVADQLVGPRGGGGPLLSLGHVGGAEGHEEEHQERQEALHASNMVSPCAGSMGTCPIGQVVAQAGTFAVWSISTSSSRRCHTAQNQAPTMSSGGGRASSDSAVSDSSVTHSRSRRASRR